MKNLAGILVGIALKLCIIWGRMDILTMLNRRLEKSVNRVCLSIYLNLSLTYKLHGYFVRFVLKDSLLF